MIRSWLFYAVIAGMAANIFHFINRYVLRDNDRDANANAWFFEVFRLLSFGILAIFDFSLQVSFSSITTLVLLGLVETATVYFYMQMQQMTHLSVSTLILRSRLIWVPLIAFFVLHERLLGTDYLGIVILFLGLSTAAAPSKIFIDRGIKASYLTSVSGALGSVFLKAASGIASDPVVMMAMAVPSVVLFPIKMRHFVNRMQKYMKRQLPLKLLAGFSNTLSFYFLVLALQNGPVSLVSGIYQAMSMLLIVAGIVILKEREHIAKKIIGAIITTTGIIIVSWK